MVRSGMRSGFSLVELSIVLVILGLLTGGILAGQSLIRGAELRSVTADMGRYRAAFMTFRDKYMAYPGDMPNATNFWGIAGGTGIGSACFTVDSSVAADPRTTCNGNGDGRISVAAGATTADVWAYGERFRQWQQLGNAGLLEGSYSGRTDSTTNNAVFTAGKNIPAARMGNAGYDVVTLNNSSNYYAGSSLNLRAVFTFPAPNTPAQLTPEEAWSIDTKLDDSKPAYGNVQTMVRTSTIFPNCTTSDTASAAEYDLPNNSKVCATSMLYQ